MELRRTAPYFTFGVYIDQLPWKYDNLFADYRTFVEPWRTGNRDNDDLGTVKGADVRNDGSFENGIQNCALAERTNDPQADSGARLTKNQLALMIYFAFETNPVTGICNTNIPGVMSLFGWEQRQNNTRGVNIAKTELRLLEERRDNPACKDTIGIVPMFEPESMKFSRNLKYRLDGDGECDPSLGKFVFIDSRTYAKISDYCFTNQKGNPSDMLYVYMYLKSIMSYVEDPNKNQNKSRQVRRRIRLVRLGRPGGYCKRPRHWNIQAQEHSGGSGRERSNLVEAKRKEQNVLFRHQKQPSAVGQSGREDTSKSRQMSRWIVLIMPNTVSR